MTNDEIQELFFKTEKLIQDLTFAKDDLKTFEEELEYANDLDEDDPERSDAIDYAEREYYDCEENIEYLKELISDQFTPDVAIPMTLQICTMFRYLNMSRIKFERKT